MTPDRNLKPLQRLVGDWATDATHPQMPGIVVRGTATVEWLEGERFLIVRARTDHPQFPDSMSVIGNTDHDRADERTGEIAADGKAPLRLHYYDSRGVYRLYDVSIDDASWRYVREAPGFS